MRIRDKRRIKCDREQVWDMLTDFDYLVSVIPGGRNFSQSDPNECRGNLRLHAGPIRVRLKVTLKRERIRKPRSFRVRISAKGNGIKISGNVDFRLKRIEDCETELSYKVDIDFRGVPGFVIGEIKNKLKKAINDLFRSIEKACKCKEKHSRTEEGEDSIRALSRVESRFEQEAAEIISKAQKQFEEELAELISKASAQLKADLTELIRRIENHSQEEDDDAH